MNSQATIEDPGIVHTISEHIRTTSLVQRPLSAVIMFKDVIFKRGEKSVLMNSCKGLAETYFSKRGKPDPGEGGEGGREIKRLKQKKKPCSFPPAPNH